MILYFTVSKGNFYLVRGLSRTVVMIHHKSYKSYNYMIIVYNKTITKYSR